ncbi:hypothetical protein PanWU01x14_365110 [Parasponia andersonii]|uniref:Transmembrane protein n=1 Tax=Parasponia andersonii TaxID=3476 RepID=A0A2P5A636_PARAD|nr:hypothetical protein PanWU01x14_365110 [Parasponia andersonii]
MSEPATENIKQIGDATVFWLTTAFFSTLSRLRSLSLHIPVPDEQKASDYGHEDNILNGQVDLEAQDQNLELTSESFRSRLGSAQPQIDDRNIKVIDKFYLLGSSPPPERQAANEYYSEKNEDPSMNLSPLPMEAVMKPYTSYCRGESSRSVSFPRRESEHESSYRDDHDKSSFSCGCSTSFTSNSLVVSPSPSSKDCLGLNVHYDDPLVKPLSPTDPKSPNSTRGNIDVNFPPNGNDRNLTRSPSHLSLNIFLKQELSKHVFAVAVAFSPGVFILHHSNPQTFSLVISSVIGVLVAMGVAFLWNGNVVQEDYPIYAYRIQMLGYALVLGAFFIFLACFLWQEKYLFPIPLICYAFSLVVLGIKAFFKPPVAIPRN